MLSPFSSLPPPPRRQHPAPVVVLPLLLLTLLVLLQGLKVSAERRYDGDSLTYSPDGTIKQLEYAAKAVDNGNLCVGIACKDAVVSRSLVKHVMRAATLVVVVVILVEHKKVQVMIVPKLMTKVPGGGINSRETLFVYVYICMYQVLVVDRMLLKQDAALREGIDGVDTDSSSRRIHRVDEGRSKRS